MGSSESSKPRFRGHVSEFSDWGVTYPGSGSATVKPGEDKFTTQQHVLQTALDLISGDRQDQYGDADDTMTRVGQLWSVIIGTPPNDGLDYKLNIQAHEVALMMICLKIVRALKSPQYMDSWVDIAGYAAQGAASAGASE